MYLQPVSIVEDLRPVTVVFMQHFCSLLLTLECSVVHGAKVDNAHLLWVDGCDPTYSSMRMGVTTPYEIRSRISSSSGIRLVIS